MDVENTGYLQSTKSRGECKSSKERPKESSIRRIKNKDDKREETETVGRGDYKSQRRKYRQERNKTQKWEETV